MATEQRQPLAVVPPDEERRFAEALAAADVAGARLAEAQREVGRLTAAIASADPDAVTDLAQARVVAQARVEALAAPVQAANEAAETARRATVAARLLRKRAALVELEKKAKALDAGIKAACASFLADQLAAIEQLRKTMDEGGAVVSELDRAEGGRGQVLYAFDDVAGFTVGGLLQRLQALQVELRNDAGRRAQAR